jgi:hypothetical protein
MSFAIFLKKFYLVIFGIMLKTIDFCIPCNAWDWIQKSIDCLYKLKIESSICNSSGLLNKIREFSELMNSNTSNIQYFESKSQMFCLELKPE